MISILILCAVNHTIPILTKTNNACFLTGLFAFPALALLPFLLPVFQRERYNIQGTTTDS